MPAISLAFLAQSCAQTSAEQPTRVVDAHGYSIFTDNARSFAERPSEIVDFEAFSALTTEVQAYRKDRLINLDSFLALAKQPNTIILDTRSQRFFQMKHLKGAKNLAFSDFTIETLAQVIPSPSTTILIYCNNNFAFDQFSFASKIAPPRGVFADNGQIENKKPISLALNIPTFINLYGYGYRNIYELRSLVSVMDPRLEFEGSMVEAKPTKTK